MRFLAVLILCAMAGPALADFRLCNKADVTAKVAFGHFDGKAWRSEGWWTIAPKKCQTLLKGALDARYYYLYGTDGARGTWNGDTGFCTVPTGRFSIPGRGHCTARGYDRKGFFEVDTGNKTDVTEYLSD